MKYNNILNKVMGVALAALSLTACTDTWNDHYDAANGLNGGVDATLWQTISTDQQFSNFAKVVKACGYDKALNSSQMFTVFAPTNSNFTLEEADKLIETYNTCDMIFAVGPAGTGKTYLSIALAVKALKEKTIKKIILSRPAVEAGEKLGFLPGDMKDKIDPYLQPLYDSLEDMIPAAKLQDMMEKHIIQIAPLAFMRGRTLSDAVVILDEAQNTTPAQLRMFLTRMGWNTKMIITGDMTQIDLPRSQQSGLKEALGILKDIEGIGIVELNAKDIVRHKLVTKIVNAYDKHDKEYNKKIEQNESIN